MVFDARRTHTAKVQASRPPSPSARSSRLRTILVGSLITAATVLLVVGMFAIWANRLLFNPGNWSKSSARLLQNSDIRSSTANYVIDQLYANVDVPALINSGLPDALAPLGQASEAVVRTALVNGVEHALNQPQVQRLWAQANHAAAESFIDLVKGRGGPARVNRGVVTLDLRAILADTATRLGLPSGLAARLPPDTAELTVLRSDQLRLIQDGGNAIRGLALLFTILVPLLYVLALVLAADARRRALITIGLAVALAGAMALVARLILASRVAASLTDKAGVHEAIKAVVLIMTSIVRDLALGSIVLGILLAVGAWILGRAQSADSMRWSARPLR